MPAGIRWLSQHSSFLCSFVHIPLVTSLQPLPYPVRADPQVNADVGPDQQRLDIGFSLLHHCIRPLHVLLQGPVLLQDRKLGWSSR